MPTGPQGQKRPANVVGCAVMVGKIATGETEEVCTKPKPNMPKRRNGGVARSKKLTKEQRSEIARKAAMARWGK